MKEGLIEKIKSKGYWRINFQPLVDHTKLKTLLECKEAIERHSVKARGWDYPVFPQKTEDYMDIEPGNNFYSGWIDWAHHIEFWRMYQSGQFIHYRALCEDWNMVNEIEPMSSIGIKGGVIYLFTEIYEFLLRLINSSLYDEGVLVSISLNNTHNRKLWLDYNAVPFLEPIKTGLENIEYSREVSKNEIVNQSQDLALEGINYIFERFSWHHPPIEMIKTAQSNLLSGKL